MPTWNQHLANMGMAMPMMQYMVHPMIQPMIQPMMQPMMVHSIMQQQPGIQQAQGQQYAANIMPVGYYMPTGNNKGNRN
jgi:hypothetical protein